MGVSFSNFCAKEVRPGRSERILGWGWGLRYGATFLCCCAPRMAGSANKHGSRRNSATIEAPSGQVAESGDGLFDNMEKDNGRQR